ncbi:hypothetical protein C5E51_34510 [Nocardia nova]|uniref:helix-turn-helix domain-containing protein n=1 Tax=Nocardia nova TaxID=37330 RepID=UPI000CEA461F|nr:helix-turn-helix transcriptional regulator [Nocardia nova]PPJ01229.1 hypothetical protein C5E51_34510 [Nocardia nova]
MGRSRQDIEGISDDPVAEFAWQLQRQLKLVPGLTYRKLAKAVNYSHSTVASAFEGKRLPTWTVTAALLRECRVGEKGIKDWHRRWYEVRLLLDGIEPDVAREMVGPRGPRPPVKEPSRSSDNEWRPRPDLVMDFDQLAAELRRFKIAIGNPSLYELHRTMSRAGYHYSMTAVSDVFAGRSRPKMGLYRDLIQVMFWQANKIHAHQEEQELAWKDPWEWMVAWSRAEYRRSGGVDRPASRRSPKRSPRGSDAPVLAEEVQKDPSKAAALLVKMEPSVASSIITALPTPASREILTAVLEMHRAS